MSLLPLSLGCAQLLDGDHDYHLETSTTGGGGAGSTSTGGAGGTTTLACEPGETACDSACADLANDPRNCGYCGHDCLGAACNDGLCDPTELLTGLNHPDSLAVDQTHLFYTTQDGTIERILKVGGTPDVLATGVGVPASLTLQAGHVYWGDRLQKVIQRMAKNGLGSVQTLCGPQIYVDRLTVGATGIYFNVPFDWMGNGPGLIGHLALDGAGGVTWLATDLQRPHYLVIGADGLYFGQGVPDGPSYSDGFISRVPLAGGPPVNLATGELVPQGLGVDADAVYWANDITQNIRKKTFATGEITTLASGQDVPYMMVLDETHVYWTTLNAGTVARVPKVGGSVEILASGRERPFALAVDGKRVYWTESMDIGRVMSVPK